MRLIVDLDSRKFTTGTGFVSNLPPVVLKRGDEVPVEVRFLQGGVPVLLGTPFDLRLGFRAEGAEWGERVGLATGFTAPGDAATGYYEAVLDLNTAEANTALGVGTENELASVRVYGEVTWSLDSGSTWISTENRIATLYNDVNRTEEGTPLALETPLEWLTARNTERGIQPIRTGEYTLSPLSLTPTGTLIADDDSQIELAVLDGWSITGDPVEGTAEWYGDLADGGSLTLARSGGIFELTYSGPSTASDIVMASPVTAKQSPVGLTFTDGGENTILITDTAGLSAPLVGDLGLVTSSGIFYRHNGDSWEQLLKGAVLLTGAQSVAGAKTFTGTMKATGQPAKVETVDQVITPGSITEYADDAAADADSGLVSGGFYKLTGDRTLYIKP